VAGRRRAGDPDAVDSLSSMQRARHDWLGVLAEAAAPDVDRRARDRQLADAERRPRCAMRRELEAAGTRPRPRGRRCDVGPARCAAGQVSYGGSAPAEPEPAARIS
jgi:hypothetical protein